ncbi:LysR family transcriptional regulator [Ideonella oryzae]|uniref:LysR family transcriptional regulator n=1 Tax=Ideonella oryzae TaxID=2937441 RepID=A0ABT1BI19_9BURK|nr:LysR family transcriptional regulator [Ideonella oryzae]MCO5975247.1 LysR family transcriptional regulator [Ideonella oryzae]
MDLNLLRVFETVYREQHLTRAAEALALTPSAVSHALRRLREQLGDPLFVRDGKLMRPTPACLRQAPALIAQLAQLRQLLQQWGRFDAAQSRQRFRIGMPDAVELMLLPALQQALLATAPLCSIVSAHFDRAGLGRQLAAGQLDLAIDVAQPMVEPVRHARLLSDAFCLLARRGHPLQAPPALPDYLAARHVAVSTRATGVVIEDATLAQMGWQREVAVRCQNYTTALRLITDSDLLLTVPGRLAEEIDPQLRLRRWPVPFELPAVQLHVYWHAHREGDPANDWLRARVRALAR